MYLYGNTLIFGLNQSCFTDCPKHFLNSLENMLYIQMAALQIFEGFLQKKFSLLLLTIELFVGLGLNKLGYKQYKAYSKLPKIVPNTLGLRLALN